jgi:acetoin utilization protein AcuC
MLVCESRFNRLAFAFIDRKGVTLMTVAMLYREDLKEYDFGSGHPFHGDRYGSFMKLLKKKLAPDDCYEILEAKPATESDLLKICDEDYVHFCREYYHAAHAGWIGYFEDYNRYQSADNKPVGTPGNVEHAARIIVGQAKMACELVVSGAYKKVISVGGGMHHAKRRFGEGFCIYNDVAFTAQCLLDTGRYERVMVLDTDAHAGNGTAEYFRSNPRILFVDIHQDPKTIYPGTGFINDIGADEGKGHTVNIPLPPMAGNESYLLAFEEVILPLAHEFKPQIIVRNGGSDPHCADGLTYLGMTVEGFRAIGDKVREMAEICDGRQIDLIASGYNADILPYAWLSLVSGIANFPIAVEEPALIPQQFQQDQVLEVTRQVLVEVKRQHQNYWKSLR